MYSNKFILDNIVEYLNENFSQDSEHYEWLEDPNSPIIPYGSSLISLWACGAVVCIGHLLYFITEDDGSWFIDETENDCGVQNSFSIAWADSFTTAIQKLRELR